VRLDYFPGVQSDRDLTVYENVELPLTFVAQRCRAEAEVQHALGARRHGSPAAALSLAALRRLNSNVSPWPRAFRMISQF